MASNARAVRFQASSVGLLGARCLPLDQNSTQGARTRSWSGPAACERHRSRERSCVRGNRSSLRPDRFSQCSRRPVRLPLAMSSLPQGASRTGRGQRSRSPLSWHGRENCRSGERAPRPHLRSRAPLRGAKIRGLGVGLTVAEAPYSTPGASLVPPSSQRTSLARLLHCRLKPGCRSVGPTTLQRRYSPCSAPPGAFSSSRRSLYR